MIINNKLKLKNMKNLINEFNAIDKIKIFEIAVIDKRTSEREYIIFDIELIKNTLFASHETIKLVEKFEELNARTFVAFWDKLHYTNDKDVAEVKTMDFFTNEINGYHAEDVEQIQALKIGEVWSLDKGQFITRVR